MDRESKTDHRSDERRKRKAAATGAAEPPRKMKLSPANNPEKSLITFPIEEADKTIFLKLKRLNTQNMCYRLSSDMPMHTLLLDYCFRMGLVYDETKFSFKNTRILEKHTPEELKMGVGPVHIITVFSSREDSFIDMRSWRGSSHVDDNFMFLTVKPFGNKGEEDHMCCYYKYSRFQPLRWMMLDYCKRKALEAEHVCFFYQTTREEEEEELTDSTDKGVKKNVIHVLPALMHGVSTPDDLQMKDYDVLSTVCYDTGVSRQSVGKSTTLRGKDPLLTLRMDFSETTGETWCYKTSSRSTPLGWILLHYCDRMGFYIHHMSFYFEGRRLRVESTPEEFKMEDDAVIYVQRMMVGGGV